MYQQQRETYCSSAALSGKSGTHGSGSAVGMLTLRGEFVLSCSSLGVQRDRVVAQPRSVSHKWCSTALHCFTRRSKLAAPMQDGCRAKLFKHLSTSSLHADLSAADRRRLVQTARVDSCEDSLRPSYMCLRAEPYQAAQPFTAVILFQTSAGHSPPAYFF